MSKPSIVPYFTYADPAAAIDFLEQAFGLQVVIRLEQDGAVQHCEMRHGDGVIMLGQGEAARGSPGVYLVVEDVDAHHARAARAGAEIVYAPEATSFGSKRYRARDPEGHEWSFGSYAPSTEKPDWA